MEKRIITALKYTFENIKGLNEEAHILKKYSKFGRTYTLFHLCFEECGRFYLLHDYLMDYFKYKIKSQDLNYGNLKKMGYEDHRLKLTQSIKGMRKIASMFLMLHKDQNNLPYTGQKFDEELERLQNELDKITLSESELDRLKNVGLYVTFYENEFHLPDETITVKQYLNIEALADLSFTLIRMLMEFYDSKGGFLGFKTELRKLLKEDSLEE